MLEWNFCAVLPDRSSPAQPPTAAYFIFCDDLNEKDSCLPSPLGSVPHADTQSVSLADCTGVMRCLIYSGMIYSFEGKKK